MATRIPPRFVPTLTEVVRPQAPATSPAPAPWAPSAQAPRQPVQAPQASQASPASSAPALAAGAPAVVGLTEEQMVHRVMQRIDLGLERRLREAIAATVLQHTRELGPLLRDEVEQVVRQVVSQAFAEELNADPHQRP